MVALVDSYCGMVLDALDDLGIREKTMVIWTSDHGDQMWEHELFLKFNMHEASVHVPLLIDIPQGSPGARRELVEHIDVFPTICELAGVAPPASVQGKSLALLLSNGPTPEEWQNTVFSQIGDIQMVRTEEWKLNVYDGSPGELYDLKNDPQEFYNRIDDQDCADAVKLLIERLKKWAQ